MPHEKYVTYFRLFKGYGTEQKCVAEQFPTFEAAYDRMIELYNDGSRERWGIQRVSVSNYGGTTNTMIQPVWG